MDNIKNIATVVEKPSVIFDVNDLLKPSNLSILAPYRSDAGAAGGGRNAAPLPDHLDFGDGASIYGAAGLIAAKPSDTVVVKAQPAADTAGDVGNYNHVQKDGSGDVGNYNHSQDSGDVGNYNHSQDSGDVGNYNHSQGGGGDADGDIGQSGGDAAPQEMTDHAAQGKGEEAQ